MTATTFELAADDAVVTVVARGEIDMNTADDFRSSLMDAVSRRPERVHVDLAAVEFFGSEGVRCLLEACDAAEASGALLRVVNPSRTSEMVLTIVNLSALVA